MAVSNELKNLYNQGRLIPFIGAGVSQSVEWEVDGKKKHGPSWKEMVDTAANKLGFNMPELLRVRGTDLQILEYFRLKMKSFAPLNNWLVTNMMPTDEALKSSVIHIALRNLSKSNIFYTTNFDNFLERSFDLLSRQCRVLAIENDMGRANNNTCEVVKFHGDLDHPEEMVISEHQYEHRLSFHSPMDLRLRADILGRAMLFIGYSFRDPNVAYLFRRVNDELRELPSSPTGIRAYIFVPDPSDFEKQLFAARKMEVIPINGQRMTEDIGDYLDELRS